MKTVVFDPLGPEAAAPVSPTGCCGSWKSARGRDKGYAAAPHTASAAKVLAGDTVPPYGARELRRTVSRAVEQALADRIAAGTARPGTVSHTADADADGHIILTEDTLRIVRVA